MATAADPLGSDVGLLDSDPLGFDPDRDYSKGDRLKIAVAEYDRQLKAYKSGGPGMGIVHHDCNWLMSEIAVATGAPRLGLLLLIDVAMQIAWAVTYVGYKAWRRGKRVHAHNKYL
ncbi:hypothetical protein FN846DRAFT_887938 [Sphaerosporella brunnea]|uniref:Uncharacterized protein n=1 Tax=Sphaerosporella brunnea TaxID=1250544 RepID=A0A5J5F401_9PEZI|nr:hypothetical protein FN846DRAFT_887938 [Sphaerosporella brunnea]